MPRFIKKTSKKMGLPPGALVHIGEKRLKETRISIIDYDQAQFQERELERIEERFALKDKPTVTWINIEGIHELQVIKEIGRHFNIHPLVLEDILNTGHRPKVEDFGDYIFIILKMLHCDEKDNEIEAEQLSIVLGSNFVISFRESGGDVFDPVRGRVRDAKGRLRKTGADYLAYSIVDAVVDSYFMILEKLGEDIDSLEEESVTEPTQETLRRIHALKREMVFLRKSVWPLREVISTLERGDSSLIHESTGVYLRDVYDHTIQVMDTVESFRDMLSGMHDTYLSNVSNRMNAVMKVLTIIATIFIPLTFVAGIYGMNFKFMPELEWRWGYSLVLAVMAVIAVSMVIYFRRRKWL
ncbi:MAG: magnesium/cobalt transporter CorA [Candidatus Zixiibacteriota bacterium]